jgi:glycosyltransferase involved in cell wall biosynthesis
MLMGKPVIATDAGGVPELIQDGRTGFLVPPGDAAALAACLEGILDEPRAASEVGERAREWAREAFSLERQVADMSEIYKNIAHKN